MKLQEVNITIILSSILFIGLLFCVLKYCWRRRWLYYYGSKINGPLGFPLVGSFHHFLKGRDGLYQKILELSEKYKPVGKIWLGPYLYIIITRPEDIELLLKKFVNKGKLYEYIEEGLGDGILISKFEKWKGHRKCINLTFTQAILNSYMGIFTKYANELVEDLRQCSGSEIDLYPKFFQITLSNILETSMGVDPTKFRAQYMSWLTRGGELLISRFYSPLYYLDFIWKSSAAGKELYHITTQMWDYVRKVVETRRRKQLTDKGDTVSNQRNFLDYLIKITDDEGKWTIKELMDETQTMIATGSDTTATTQSYLLLMLAMNPDIQEKVHDELTTVFQGTNRDVALEDLDKMVYLEQVIKETLRLFPVAPVMLRYAHEDVALDSYVIPKDSTVLVPTLYIHKNPDVWDDPLKFDPDRFLPEEVAKRHRYAYIPFSVSPRKCIGMKFAMMSMKVTLATVLRRFRVISSQYKSVSDIDLHVDITLIAPKGYRVILKSR